MPTKLQTNIKALMKEVGFTARELANKSGVSDSCVSRIINGRRTPTIETLVKIARALDVKVDVLIE